MTNATLLMLSSCQRIHSLAISSCSPLSALGVIAFGCSRNNVFSQRHAFWRWNLCKVANQNTADAGFHEMAHICTISFDIPLGDVLLSDVRFYDWFRLSWSVAFVCGRSVTRTWNRSWIQIEKPKFLEGEKPYCFFCVRWATGESFRRM